MKSKLITALTLALTLFPASVSAFSLFPGEGGSDYREYIVNFYVFAIPAAALVGVVLIMIAGVIWVTSAGSQQRIATAKEFILNSIIGIVLLMSAYVVLGVINPNLVLLSFPKLDSLGKFGACYTRSSGACILTIKDGCPATSVFREGQDCQDEVGKSLKAEQEFIESCQAIESGDIILEQQFDPTQLRNMQQSCITFDSRQAQFEELACVGRHRYALSIDYGFADRDCKNRCRRPCTSRLETVSAGNLICFCENSTGFSGLTPIPGGGGPFGR